MSEKICAACLVICVFLRFWHSLFHHGETETKTWNAYYELLNLVITLSLFYVAGLFNNFK